jgi:hypothetical protein
MLPSTNYFKTYYCPFYQSGLCTRPYCHYKDEKKVTVTKSKFTIVFRQSADRQSAELRQSADRRSADRQSADRQSADKTIRRQRQSADIKIHQDKHLNQFVCFFSFAQFIFPHSIFYSQTNSAFWPILKFVF